MDQGIGARFIINNIVNDIEDAENQAQEPIRRFYRQEPAFELSETKFIKIFRLSKELARSLIQLVAPFMQGPTRASALSVQTKVFVALRFFATGSYQEISGSSLFTAVSQPSVSRSIREVTLVLNRPDILNQWIKFPQNIEELENIRIRFYQKFQFPGIVGIIDCTHVAIVAPQGQDHPEHIYVNRKGYHSINVQLICDENLKILNVDARFPGSVHDAHIWRQSNISFILERVYRNQNNNLFFLLGDSGYPLRPWLMTPLERPPNDDVEERFNARQKSVRSIIERCNGVLKNRFRCLLKHRVLHYMPERASAIINSCVLLHNMCINANVPEPDYDALVIDNVDFGMYANEVLEQPIGVVNPDLAIARQIQLHVAANHFRNN